MSDPYVTKHISVISVRNLLLHYVARYCIISTRNHGKNMKKMSCIRHITWEQFIFYIHVNIMLVALWSTGPFLCI